MITAQFGTKQFSVSKDKIYTPSDISLSESLDIEETEVVGEKPTTSVKGIKLQTLSFVIMLDARFVDVATELRWWKNVLRSKASHDLFIGSYKIGNFYVSQYDASGIVINRQGEYVSAKLSLSFTENGTTETKTPISFEKASSGIKVRVGSTVKPISGTRRYGSADNALGKKGTSSKNEIIDHKVTSIHSGKEAVKIKATSGKTTYEGWVRIEDLALITY